MERFNDKEQKNVKKFFKRNLDSPGFDDLKSKFTKFCENFHYSIFCLNELLKWAAHHHLTNFSDFGKEQDGLKRWG